MSNFSQKHTKITNLYLFGKGTEDLKPRIRKKASGKRSVLVIPALATEFTEPENRPVFENILKQLSSVSYLYKIVFGLDAANDDEALELARHVCPVLSWLHFLLK